MSEFAVDEPMTPMRHFADEAAHRDGQATDALFLTFNADLAFLESRLLDLCRQAGARVTVVADADVWAPDTRAITRAGVRYHVGLVAAYGAFHPKVSIIAGPQRALAVVGSGNLGMAGWQHNAELTTVLKGDLKSAPRALADLRDLLDTLATRAELDQVSVEAINRVSAQLTDLLANTAAVLDTGHQLVSSWDGRLIERLPDQPVDELLLLAAFHDPDSAAVSALLQRLQPKRVQVALQPGSTVVDPAVLNEVLEGYAAATGAAVAVVRDPDSGRYRHGKLIEWAAESGRAAMTGSPNLSRMALLRSALDGNFEVAVLAPVERSLWPGGDVIERVAEVPARTIESGLGLDRHGPVVTSAVLTGNTVTVRLSRVAIDLKVEVSRYGDPDSWEILASVPAGEEAVVLPPVLSGGDRLRLVWTDGSGMVHSSPPVFVTDPATAQRRPNESGRASRLRDTVPAQLWSDDLTFLESVLGELDALTEELAGRIEPLVKERRAEPVSEPVTTRQPKVEPWLWVRDETLERLGPGIGPYALGLPPLPAGRREMSPDWTDDAVVPRDAAPELEVDREKVDADEEEHAGAEPIDLDHTQSPPHIQAGRRRWCQRAEKLAPTLPAQYRLLLLRLALRLWKLGNWPDGDIEPLKLVASLTRSLEAPNVPPDAPTSTELAERLGSLAAVAAAFVRRGTDPSLADDRTLLYQELRKAIAHLLPEASTEVMMADLEGLVSPNEVPSRLYEAQGIALDAAESDPLGDLQRDLLLEESTRSVTRPGRRLLHLTADKPQSRIFRWVMELIARAEDEPGVGIWVSNLDGDWALAVWQPPDLVRVTSRSQGEPLWHHQRLRETIGLRAVAVLEARGESTAQFRQGRRGPRTDAAVDILASVGIEDPAPPAEFPPSSGPSPLDAFPTGAD